MKIYICDDDLNMLYMLKTWLVEYMEDREYQIQIYDNGIDMIYEVEHSDSQEPQIIFMDIKLKNDNGIDVAKVIKRLNQNAVIIFISGYTEYFEDSFEADPVYFLIKPLKKDVFEKAMGKALNKISKKNNKFLLLRKKDVSRIFLDEIYYVESEGRKIHIHCQQGKTEYYDKLDILEEQLEGDFVRCHKSYLVNMKWVRCVDHRSITLLDGKQIPVSRNRLAQTKEKVFEYLGRQLG